MNDVWLIYPATKRAVAVLAWAALASLGGAAVLGAAELALAPAAQAAENMDLLQAALWSGLAGEYLLLAATALLAPVAAWGHDALLAGRGMAVTRLLGHLGVFLALLMPVCTAYTFATGKLLLASQGEIPLILAFILATTALLNVPAMSGSILLRACVVLTPAFLLGAYILYAPGMLPLSTVCTILAAAAAFLPLRLLATTATRIVSLPEKLDE